MFQSVLFTKRYETNMETNKLIKTRYYFEEKQIVYECIYSEK